MTQSLVVDLSGAPLPDEEAFCDAVIGPMGLLEWFSRNLDAWTDTIEGGRISELVDAASEIVIRVRREGLFGPGLKRVGRR